jgi:signal peptidase I
LKLRTFAALSGAVVAVLAIGMHTINPLGVPDMDPRGRILGVIPYRMPAESMLPTIPSGTIVVVCTGPAVRPAPQVGDIVAYRNPPDFQTPYLKRIVALGGDSVEFKGTEFRRNGVLQKEPYIAAAHDYAEGFSGVVPTGSVFIAGDNRERSMDSRYVGPVPNEMIIGRACAGV